jgi:hypothetical protein
VGGLAHYFEDEGLATTQISLIREHTEVIKPPRALWVPFELGRPLGPPNDPVFQKRVLLRTLNLLEAPGGPVLEYFPKDAQAGKTDDARVACPISFKLPNEDMSATDLLIYEFRQEVSQMRNWYDLATEMRGRTTAGTTGLEPDEVVEFIAAFIQGKQPSSPMPGAPLGTALKMATEDLKAYYFEAVTAQPGQPTDSDVLADWFWAQTRAARIINTTREICINSEDKNLKRVGKLLLVPRTQSHRF